VCVPTACRTVRLPCHDDLRLFWTDAKAMEQQAISRLKELVAQEVRNGCF
jgi:hypothetical protein